MLLQGRIIQKPLLDFISKDGVRLPHFAALAPASLEASADVQEEALGGGITGGATEFAV